MARYLGGTVLGGTVLGGRYWGGGYWGGEGIGEGTVLGRGRY